MDLLVAIGIFLAGMMACLSVGASLAWALLLGLLCFLTVGLRRGWGIASLLKMSYQGVKSSFVVLRILLMIGVLTALWRASGTIAYFVYVGVQMITPRSFILVAFLLPAILCLAFGSSFGVSSTAGVIMMTIAHSGGGNLVLTAGAIISGAFVGERLSPASSAAALVAAVAGAEQREFQRRMWRTSLLPLLLTTMIYGVLSALFPIQSMDTQVLAALKSGFVLTWPTVMPALALLILPWLHINAFYSIVISSVLAFGIALFVQGVPVAELLRSCILGHTVLQPELTDILSGGGLKSMVSVVIIVFLSCTYSGLFTGTGMLDSVKKRIGSMADRIGLFPAHVVLSLCCCGLFCNQSVGIVMSAQFMKEYYRDSKLEPIELAVNLGDTVINLAGIIPWNIACSVPLAVIGGSLAAVPMACFLYLVPMCSYLTRFVLRSNIKAAQG